VEVSIINIDPRHQGASGVDDTPAGSACDAGNPGALPAAAVTSAETSFSAAQR